MKKQISLSEIESMIRNHIDEKGFKTHISDNQIEEIKNKIKTRMSMPSSGIFYMNPPEDTDSIIDAGGDFSGGMEEEVIPSNEEDQTMPISNYESDIEASKEEVGIDQEQELSYQPQLPNAIQQAEPGKLFVYDMMQLALGGESLSSAQYNCKDNPELKQSMHDLWLNDGKIRAEIFKVEYKSIGELVFDPFNGTTKFVEMQQPLESDLPKEDREGVEHAINSQFPIDPMVDSTDPITDVILPPNTDMGLGGIDVQKSIENTVEKILRQYFSGK